MMARLQSTTLALIFVSLKIILKEAGAREIFQISNECTDILDARTSKTRGGLCAVVVEDQVIVTAKVYGKDCKLAEVRFCNLPFVTPSDRELTKEYTFQMPVDEVNTFLCSFEDGADVVAGDIDILCGEDGIEQPSSGYFEVPISCNGAVVSSPVILDEHSSSETANLGEIPGAYSSLVSYTLEEVKYPTERLPLEELNFCDIGYSGMSRMGNEALECPPPTQPGKFDPSCLSCIPEAAQTVAASVWSKYRDEALQRREVYNSWLSQTVCETNDISCTESVVVVSADDEELPFLSQWWCHSNKQGLQRSQLIIFSRGDTVTKWSDDNGLFVVDASTYGVDTLDGLHKWALYPLFADLLKMGKHVVYNDVDIVWTDNMASRLLKMWNNVQLISALSPRRKGQVGLDSAILSMRPTEEIIVFVETLMSIMPLNLAGAFGHSGEDLPWNHLLRHYAFRSLTWRGLPQSYLARGEDRTGFEKGRTIGVRFNDSTMQNEKRIFTQEISQFQKLYGDVLEDSCVADGISISPKA